ncbi:MAG: hypothetical protein Q3962_05695 [Corynebacterium sp.]|nr:hypothetical protein [Corynebacterium sp.]
MTMTPNTKFNNINNAPERLSASILDDLRNRGWHFEAILAHMEEGMTLNRKALKKRVDDAFIEIRRGLLPCPAELTDLQILLYLDDAYSECRWHLFPKARIRTIYFAKRTPRSHFKTRYPLEMPQIDPDIKRLNGNTGATSDSGLSAA